MRRPVPDMADDLAAIEARHQPHPRWTDWCLCGWRYKNCDTRRVLDALQAERFNLRLDTIIDATLIERERVWEAIDAEPTIDGRIHRDRLRAIIDIQGQEFPDKKGET